MKKFGLVEIIIVLCLLILEVGGADIPGSACFIYKGCNNRNLRTEEWLKSL